MQSTILFHRGLQRANPTELNFSSFGANFILDLCLEESQIKSEQSFNLFFLEDFRHEKITTSENDM